eukprot:COSAG02_NODE_21712_length_777_cov_2.563422_1_plen_81_part_00
MDASPRGLCPIFVRRTTVRANRTAANSRTKNAVPMYLLPRGHSRQSEQEEEAREFSLAQFFGETSEPIVLARSSQKSHRE